MLLKGIVRSFNGATHQATVQIVGSEGAYLASVEVSANISGVDVSVGRKCAVLLFSPENPDDAVVVAVWD